MKLGLLVLLAAAPAAAEPALRGNVVVWADAKLYLDPDDKAPTVQIATLARSRDESPGFVIPMTIVTSGETFVQVEPTKDVECTWAQVDAGDDLAKLRLWVKRADLAPVLAKPFRASFKDGTKVTLEVGTPIVGGLVSILGDRIAVKVPESSIARSYKPHRIRVPPPPGKVKFQLEGKSVTVGEAPVAISAVRTASRITRRGDRVLFPLAARCMSAIVSVDDKQVIREERTPPVFGGLLGGEMPPGPGFWLPKGHALTSTTGSAAVAVAAEKIDFFRGTSHGDKQCITRELVAHQHQVPDAPRFAQPKAPGNEMLLCAPRTSLVFEP